MIAVAMPLFVFIDFLDHTVAWLEANPLAVLVFVAGLLACGFLALLWHDTRYDDIRREYEQLDRPPVQIHICPVCDLPVLEMAPENGPVCPACGTEFEVDDRYQSHAALRDAWLRSGAEWSGSYWRDRPANWESIRRSLLATLPSSTLVEKYQHAVDDAKDAPTRILDKLDGGAQ